MSKEAMKLALEALEAKGDAWIVLERKAKAAIREALAEQPAQGCDYCNHPQYAGTKCKNCGRLAEKQAPVQQCMEHGECFGGECIYPDTQPAQQEPVAWAIVGDGEWGEYTYGMHFENSAAPNHKYWELRGYELQPLYTSPPAQRKPLTDELNQIEKDLSFHGLTLVKTATGYAVLKLGQITAHAKENT